MFNHFLTILTSSNSQSIWFMIIQKDSTEDLSVYAAVINKHLAFCIAVLDVHDFRDVHIQNCNISKKVVLQLS